MKNLLVLSSLRRLMPGEEPPRPPSRRSGARLPQRPLPGVGGHSRVWRLESAPDAPSVKPAKSAPEAAAPEEAAPAPPPMARECWEVPVLYEDEHLLALNKPPLLATSLDRADPERPSLMKLLHADLVRGAGWAKERGLTYLANAHRLDYEVSGVFLLAKSRPALVALANLFGSHKPMLTFVALVHGAPHEREFEVDAKIRAQPGRPGIMRVDPKHGKTSRTLFHEREAFRGHTLLECVPLTERPHQVRLHLRCARLSLVADRVYGGPPLWLSDLKKRFLLKEGHQEKPLLERVALHAERLCLPHPVTGAELRIEAPFPKDFAVALKYLRRYAAATHPASSAVSPPETEMGSA